ncbi:A-kinase anchor protein 1, mitochondrial isoform X1 [Electrophorus electricus]|uniref:A-kinase anchor protein 1, mitochondrial isoform X1 n=1 Tax=Electrophorus electricus TaxID=8005 RepID=UPI0015D0BF9C|nr:A-kinase anchor protein 1, mitochondrial isoform X1 [Electrophorus electricus]
MLPRSLRPLMPLSALALLGWCWYIFKRKRSTGVQVEESGLVFPSAAMGKQGAVGCGSSPRAQDRNAGQLQKGPMDSWSCSSNSDRSVDPEASDNSSLNRTIDESVLSAPLLSDTPTSSLTPRPLKGVRPEPEGGASEARASALLTEKPEAETERDGVISKGLLGLLDSTVAQTTRTASPTKRRAEVLVPQELEHLPFALDKEVQGDVTEEILMTGDIVLKRKHQEEPSGFPLSEVETVTQDHLQWDTGKNGILLVSRKELRPLEAQQADHAAPRGAEEEEPIQCNQSTSPSAAKSEVSGGGVYHVENGAGPEEPASQGETHSDLPEEDALATCSVDSEHKMQEIHHTVAGRSGQPSTQSAGANGGNCVNREGGGSSSRDRAVPSPSSGLVLWEMEVPVHLVGRLIGKQGKHVGFLKRNSGAKIYLSTLPYTHEFQICHIEGSEVQVENALALIKKKFKDLDLSNRLVGTQLAAIPSLPITSWLLLPQEGTVEVIVPRVEAANYLFVQQHTHPSYYALQGLAEQMLFCYSRPGCPSLPAPVEAGVLCAAPSVDGSWWRAQVIQHYKNSNYVQIRYVDYGGYVTVNLSALRQIRSDFVSLPFQASEVMLENVRPLPGREEFSLEAREALEELTRGVALIIKVTGTQSGLPLVHMWRQAGEETISVNWLLAQRGLCSWLGSH